MNKVIIFLGKLNCVHNFRIFYEIYKINTVAVLGYG